jgi:hypothetical protein
MSFFVGRGTAPVTLLRAGAFVGVGKMVLARDAPVRTVVAMQVVFNAEFGAGEILIKIRRLAND